MNNWTVYILRCSDDSLYTGITTDLTKRLFTHNRGNGAKYLRGRLPVKVAYQEGGHSRNSALKRELALKAFSKTKKMALVEEDAIIIGPTTK